MSWRSTIIDDAASPPGRNDVRERSVRDYLDLVRTPGVAKVTASQLFARLPIGMLSLAILLQVQARSGSYAVAGAVVAGMSVGQAISMPLTARLAGHLGIVTTLLATAGANAAAVLALAFARPRAALLIALGVLIGASVPPLMPVIRALYPQIVAGDALRVLFALDTSAQELIWIVGPVAATLLASMISPATPLVIAAIITVTGTCAFLLSLNQRQVGIVRSAASFGRVLTRRPVILALVASLALVGSFTALEVGIVADLGRSGVVAGAAIAMSSLGSLVGGIAVGHRRLGVTGLVSVLTVVTIGTALSGVLDDLVPRFAALFAAGFGFAPAMSAVYLTVSQDVEAHATTEAFGWINTGSLVGAAIGTASAGVASDAFGVSGAFTAATILAMVATVSPLVIRHSRPDGRAPR
jgi:MFS family permease